MIPARAHFIWFGRDLPLLYAVALVAASRFGELDEIVLHHSDDLASSPQWPLLRALPGFESRRIDAVATLRDCRAAAEGLEDVFAQLEQPAAKANVLRAAILWREGGVYLDTDAIAVRSLRPLLAHGAFHGEERILHPYRTLRQPSPLHRLRTRVLGRLRERAASEPDGYRWFRRVSRLLPRAANNAVIGCEPRHALPAAMLRRMAAAPVESRTVRYALGTHLLQQIVEGARPALSTVVPPEVFYPLPPVVCRHWARDYDDAPRRLDELLGSATRVVHWYASNATQELVEAADAAYVRAHAGGKMLCALAARSLAP